MLTLFDKFVRKFSCSQLIQRAWHRVRYPGVSIAGNANLDIRGDFSYGSGCSIGVGSNIIVPEQTNLIFGDGCYIGRYVELGPGNYIEIGSQTSIQDRSIFVGDVIIGRYCLISLNVLISSGRHYFNLKPEWLIKDQDFYVAQDKKLSDAHSKPVIIEDDCWLGANVVVMPGVKIGRGSVIGANSVITKDVEPYSVMAGAPAKRLRKRLNFVPPRSINYSNSSDWPYFYSGFKISQAEMNQYAESQGITALDEFTLCLDASLGKKIHIVARSVATNNCALVLSGKKFEILNQFQEVVFDIDEHSRNKQRFLIQADTKDAVLIIQKAWIQ